MHRVVDLQHVSDMLESRLNQVYQEHQNLDCSAANWKLGLEFAISARSRCDEAR